MNDKHFIDWQNDVFGYGYGTGEQFTLPALKRFFELLCDGRRYNYEAVEGDFGQLAAWLLINILCHAGILEYGTSSRYGWITPRGEALRDYLSGKTADELYELTATDENYVHCYPDHCNCATRCENPLWA